MVNANAPVAPVLPAPVTDTTTGASGVGFKARTASRSTPRTGSRLQNASKPITASTAAVAAGEGTVVAKQNQSKEQAEKKNQAISQLRRLLVQGNKRVEALATVIQHLFSEVRHLFLFTCRQPDNTRITLWGSTAEVEEIQ